VYEPELPTFLSSLGYGLNDRGSFPGRGSDVIFSLHHSVQTGFGAHPPSYPMGNEGSSPA